MKKNIKIKNKIINFLAKKGETALNEKIFIKSIKELQKNTKKATKDIIKAAVISVATPFKILIFKQKKRKKKKVREVPFFIKAYEAQIYLAIKNLTESIQNKQKNSLYKRLQNEFFLAAQQSEESLKVKKNIQKLLTTKKRLLNFYKW
jgi:ribosomal protein S7